MKQLIAWLPDLLMVGGAAATSYGIGLAYRPAGFTAAGLFAIAAGVLLARKVGE